MKDWFVGDKEGLRQVNERLVERRGFGIIGGELYQNVMDTDATECTIQIERVLSRPRIIIVVTDNGPGFSKLSDAWTLFAPSEKKDDPTKAGRFNLGEKMVLSFAHHAIIHTTSGTVKFNRDGRRNYPRQKREKGTCFTAVLAGTTERYNQLIEYMHKIIVRDGLRLKINGHEVPHRIPIHHWQETLATEIGDNLRSTRRQTNMQVYEVNGNETAMLYELGIPVVETDDKWHINIQQKVPLNTDRDNVTPAYLRAVRVSMLNQMYREIGDDDTESAWVNEATSSPGCSNEAAEAFRIKKYGKKSVVSDPFNREADSVAQSEGYTIIPSHGLTRGQRDNLKDAGTLKSSSAEFPTAGKGAYSDNPDAPPVEVVPQNKWSDGMKKIKAYTAGLACRLLDRHIAIRFVIMRHYPGKPWGAAYGNGQFDFNVHYLGRHWFDQGATEDVDSLILHELGHETESDHCSANFHQVLTKLGAKLKAEALKDPQWFRSFLKA